MAPELYPNISAQLKNQPSKMTTQKQLNSITRSFTPGSKSQAYYLDNVTLGITFWRFNKRANWSWNANGITSLTTSCWASQVYAGWSYNGVVDQYQGWIYQPASKYTYSMGEFTCAVDSSNPYITINVYATGTSSSSGGFE